MKDILNGMRVFAHVVEAKSFSAAADKLDMSKSVASRTVSALERELAVKLLNRSTRKLTLTEAGALYYEHCATVVREARMAGERVARLQTEPAGLVKVSAVQPFAVRHVLPALPEFRKRYPQVQLRVSCGNRMVDLGESGFDLGIRIGFQPDPNVIARRLALNRAVLCAAPSYLQRRGAPRRVADMARHDCVLFPVTAPRNTWTLQRDGRTETVPVTPVLESDDMEVIHAAVLAGMGVGLLPAYVAGAALRAGKLVPILPSWRMNPESSIYLAYLPALPLPSRLRVLIDFLVEHFAGEPAWEQGWQARA